MVEFEENPFIIKKNSQREVTFTVYFFTKEQTATLKTQIIVQNEDRESIQFFLEFAAMNPPVSTISNDLSEISEE